MPLAVPILDDSGQPILKPNGEPTYGWKHLQTKRETREGIAAYFAHQHRRTGLGIFTGAISGGVVLFEFDDRRTYELFKGSAEALGLGDLIARIEDGYTEDTPSGGVHWLVRVEQVGRNRKLARRPKRPDEMEDESDRTKVLIETREEGGWVVLAPSHGRVHGSGRPYVLRAGNFSTIATLSANEQQQLWALAETFDDMPDEERFALPSRPKGQTATAGGPERPGDRFERETDWFDILPAGWRAVGKNADNLLLCRPGTSQGWSATLSHGGSGVLYMFTSSAAPFEPGGSYTKFGAYTLLAHGGDWKAATKALAERFGMQSERPRRVLQFVGGGGGPTGGGDPPTDGGDGGGDGEAEPEVPLINAGVLDLTVITDQAWDAIRLANRERPFMFRHGGTPVRVEHDDESRPILRELAVDHFRHLLARVARFVIFSKKGEDDGDDGEPAFKVVLPPIHVCRDVLVTPNPPLPVIVRVTECPVFGPDGALQTTPGYHAASRTYLAIPPDIEIPAVPDDPTAEDLDRAKSLILDDILGDFPFVSDADRANIVALGLEPFVRAMVSGSQPMHGIEGPVPGSGKGLLVEAILRPSCGRNVAAFPQAKDDDEWRKRLTSMFERGYPAVLIDNVNRPLESGSLAMALTIGIWTDRVLGTSKTISVPVRCSWVLTANNPTYSTEMARRTVRSRIDPKVDRPQERDGWRHAELLAWIDEHRGELIWAFCVLVRSWLAAGRPDFSGKALGSYERWSHVLGGILEHVGIEGFLSNQGAFYELADVEASTWRAFVATWWERFGSNEVGPGDLFPLALEAEGFELGNGSERAQKTRFGKLLGQQRDRIIGEHRVTPTRTLARAQRWRLLPTSGVNVVNVSEHSQLQLSAHESDEPDTPEIPGEKTFTDVHDVHTPTVEVPPLSPARSASWRCPKCRGMERTVHEDLIWRCDGCGATGSDLCPFCRREPIAEGGRGCSSCEGRGT